MTTLTLKVTAQNVTLLDKPINGQPIGHVNPQDALTSLESTTQTHRKIGRRGQWLKVRTLDGREAYIGAWLLDVVERFDDDQETERIPALDLQAVESRLECRPMMDGVVLRDAPMNGNPISRVNRDTVLLSLESLDETRRKIGREGEWLRVRLPTGMTAYVAAWLLELADGQKSVQ